MNAVSKLLFNGVQLDPEVARITPQQVRNVGEAIQQIPGHLGQDAAKLLTSHFFCDGLYMREFFLPSGMLAVGKIHRYESFFVVLLGEATITLADGSVKRLTAPYIAVTQPGGQRIVMAHRDTVFLTFHANPGNSHDIEEVEMRLTVPELEAPTAMTMTEALEHLK